MMLVPHLPGPIRTLFMALQPNKGYIRAALPAVFPIFKGYDRYNLPRVLQHPYILRWNGSSYNRTGNEKYDIDPNHKPLTK